VREYNPKEWKAHGGGGGNVFNSRETVVDPYLHNRPNVDGTALKKGEKAPVREYNPKEWTPHCGGVQGGEYFHKRADVVDSDLHNRPGVDGTALKKGEKAPVREYNPKEWKNHCGGVPSGNLIYSRADVIDEHLHHRPHVDNKARKRIVRILTNASRFGDAVG